MEADNYKYSPAEHPMLPGSPYMPAHPLWRKMVYVLAALQAAVTATLGNALISTNIPSISGSLGEYAAAVSLLPAMYVAMNATGNLSIVKMRIQWGIPFATKGALGLYALAALLQFLFPNYAMALVTRATSGLAASALITVGIYYLFQVVPAKFRPHALVGGIGLTQIGTPLARLFPVEMLAQDHWQSLHLIELALPLAMLAMMQAFPLPPSDRGKAFEKLDFLTIGLVIPAVILVSAVLAEGRAYWWTDTPWLGWTLAAAVPLVATALLLEYLRSKPILFLDFIGSGVIIRFAAVALLMRLALAEQTYGSVGLLAASGLDNGQMRLLFLGVLGAMALGLAAAVFTLNPQRIREQVIVAALIMALGAWMDSHATSQTRPHELYISQALLGFGATLFIGPTLAFGFLRMIVRGPAYFVSLVVLFSTTQNVGSLLGSAVLGTYQVASARAHAAALAEHLVGADPQVITRLQSGSQLLAATVPDPAQQAALGGALLAQAQAREAAVLAFNDVFRFVALVALGTALFLSILVFRDFLRARKAVAVGVRA